MQLDGTTSERLHQGETGQPAIGVAGPFWPPPLARGRSGRDLLHSPQLVPGPRNGGPRGHAYNCLASGAEQDRTRTSRPLEGQYPA